MNQHDAERFARAIAAMAATFRQEATDALFEGYRLGLEGLPIDSVEQAVKRAIQGCKFMPSAAELRELAGELLPADRAIKAWAIVERAVSRHGEGPSLDFSDKLTNAAIRNLGGWESLIDKWEEEGKTWVRKEFERVYVSFCRSGITASQAAPLIGFNERKNRHQGYMAAIPKGLEVACGAKPVPVECDLPPMPLAIKGPSDDTAEGQQMLQLLDNVGKMPEDG